MWWNVCRFLHTRALSGYQALCVTKVREAISDDKDSRTLLSLIYLSIYNVNSKLWRRRCWYKMIPFTFINIQWPSCGKFCSLDQYICELFFNFCCFYNGKFVTLLTVVITCNTSNYELRIWVYDSLASMPHFTEYYINIYLMLQCLT